MLKTRIFLVLASAALIWLIFLLPKVVVDNDQELSEGQSPKPGSTSSSSADVHEVPENVASAIRNLRVEYRGGSSNEKNAIFADSLASLYQSVGKFDSAGWYAEEASKFYNTAESWIKAGDQYYQAYTLALDQNKQTEFAKKAQGFYQKVLESNPANLEVKTKMAMTFITTSTPMQGIKMLMEVLKEDPQNESALFNLGMLSIQSGQNDKAVERLDTLVKINPNHTQAQLLLGIAWMNLGDELKARVQFEKVKQMDKDPAVQATVDSYLKDLK
jgi:tetratricopeptide (TPR) repeat protein